MFKIDSSLKQNLINAMIANQEKAVNEIKTTLGEPTDFKCHCGGIMHRRSDKAKIEKLRKELGRPRYSRKKRQIKKNHKKWLEKNKSILFLNILVSPLRSQMGFVCASCGVNQGFYTMMAKAMFPIEQMPQGAVLFYDKGDPNND